MGKGAPSGPSDQEIRAESELERERIKFEQEKQRFVERVAGIDLLKSEQRRATAASFQVQGVVQQQSNATAPSPFDPTFDPLDFMSAHPQGNITADDYAWFKAPNLGLNPGSQGAGSPKDLGNILPDAMANQGGGN